MMRLRCYISMLLGLALLGCSAEDGSQHAQAPTAQSSLAPSLAPLQSPLEVPADYIARRPASLAPAIVPAADDLPLWPPAPPVAQPAITPAPATTFQPFQPAPAPTSAPPLLPETVPQSPAPPVGTQPGENFIQPPFSPAPSNPAHSEAPPATTMPAVVPPTASTPSDFGPALGDPNPLRDPKADLQEPADTTPPVIPAPAPVAPVPTPPSIQPTAPATIGNPLRTYSLPLAGERPVRQFDQMPMAPVVPTAEAPAFVPRIPAEPAPGESRPLTVQSRVPEPMGSGGLLPHAPETTAQETIVTSPMPVVRTYSKLPRVSSALPKPGASRSVQPNSLSSLPKSNASNLSSGLVAGSNSSSLPRANLSPALPQYPAPNMTQQNPSGGSASPSDYNPADYGERYGQPVTPPSPVPPAATPTGEVTANDPPRFLSPGTKSDPPVAAPPAFAFPADGAGPATPPTAPQALATVEPEASQVPAAVEATPVEPAAPAPAFESPMFEAPAFVQPSAPESAAPNDAAPVLEEIAGAQAATAPQEVTLPPVKTDEPFDVVRVFYGTDRLPIIVNQDGLVQRLIRFTPPAILILLSLMGVGVVMAARQLTWLIGTSLLIVLSTLATWYSVRETIAIAERASLEEPKYSAEKSERGRVERGICEVTIPKTHKPGELEGPSILRLEVREDVSKHIVLRKTVRLQDQAFYEQLKAQVHQSPERELLVFVHGFNVTFEDAARRTAQMAKDLELRGAPVFFSWPADKYFLLTYGKDETNVGWATPHLKQFLLDIVAHTDAKAVNLVAHSMGNRALTTALREIDLELRDQARMFNQVVLAAPDIDADDFRDNIAPAIQRTAKQVTLYASANDIALGASRFFHRNARAGDTSRGLVLVAGMHTIDVSAIDGGPWGHSYYGASDPVLRDLHLLFGSLPPERRTWLKSNELDGQTYWAFRPTDTAKAPAIITPR
ncbi:hypothetical protein ETAA8_51720 [Anatilimnocola aggregata]|uniref:Alpha/beta hydrolase n=1 Tax=Anatilimnocola aggregata TaxID=2528021 RepID=A0A517YIJ3_9BACT|nr:alpha/beta hydrolase [Anatilimnocola aggregata]QDU30053.1 hypothetical protein ETAA8_51720 [Anatilimnocola aggregata]